MPTLCHSNPCRRLFVALPLVVALAACNGESQNDEQPRVFTQSQLSLYQSGLQAEREGRYALATDQYAQFLKSTARLMAEAETTRTHAMLKLSVIEEAQRFGQDEVFDRFLAAINLRESGEWTAAIDALEALLPDATGHYLEDDIKYLRAYILLTDRRHYSLADQLMGELIEAHPDSTYADSALYSRGVAQRHLGNTAVAESYLLELRERHAGISIDLLNLHYPQDNFVAKLWFARVQTQLDALYNETGAVPTPEQMQERDDDSRPNIVVVFTDDQGYADLNAQNILTDVSSPHLDQLAADGIRMTDGYVTAPQCTPSRAGLLTGKYQQRFGLDDNRFSPLPLSELTLADRLGEAGYRTGMVGKWHLEVSPISPDYDLDSMSTEERAVFFPEQRGFDDVFFGYSTRWWANYDLAGESVPLGYHINEGYRLDVATDAALAFTERYKQQPFFLYLSYFAPHVPLEATEKYLERFPNTPEVRRQHALAMISAMDDGIGRLRQNLQRNGLTDNTLLFFISDNGAPLGIHKLDLPIDEQHGAWDGSLNDPWVGEKGMLTEGGVRVPYIVSWPGVLPTQTTYSNAVSTLDVAATSLAAAGIEPDADLDGTNLIPHLQNPSQPELEQRSLFWRFWSQSAIRKGQWKLLRAGDDREYLFNLESSEHETRNLIGEHTGIAQSLRRELNSWDATLQRDGEDGDFFDGSERRWYNYYLP